LRRSSIGVLTEAWQVGFGLWTLAHQELVSLVLYFLPWIFLEFEISKICFCNFQIFGSSMSVFAVCLTPKRFWGLIWTSHTFSILKWQT
jgi:hypothetical protein